MVEKRSAGRTRRSRSRKSHPGSPEPEDQPLKTGRSPSSSPELQIPVKRMKKRSKAVKNGPPSSGGQVKPARRRHNYSSDSGSCSDASGDSRGSRGSEREKLPSLKRKNVAKRRPDSVSSSDDNSYDSADYGPRDNHEQNDQSLSEKIRTKPHIIPSDDDNEIDLGIVSKKLDARRNDSSSSGEAVKSDRSLSPRPSKRDSSNHSEPKSPPLDDSFGDQRPSSSEPLKRSNSMTYKNNKNDDKNDRQKNRKSKLARGDWPKFPGNQREFGDSAAGKYRRNPAESKDDREWRWQHDTERQRTASPPDVMTSRRKQIKQRLEEDNGKGRRQKSTSSPGSPLSSNDDESAPAKTTKNRRNVRSRSNSSASSDSEKVLTDREDGERSQSKEKSDKISAKNRRSTASPISQKRRRRDSSGSVDGADPGSPLLSPASRFRRRSGDSPPLKLSKENSVKVKPEVKRRRSSASPVMSEKRRRRRESSRSLDVDDRLSPASRFRSRPYDSPPSSKPFTEDSPSKNIVNSSISRRHHRRRSGSFDDRDAGRQEFDSRRRQDNSHFRVSNNRFRRRRSRSPQRHGRHSPPISRRSSSPTRRHRDNTGGYDRRRGSRSPPRAGRSREPIKSGDEDGVSLGVEGPANPDDWFAQKRKLPKEVDPLKIKSGGAYIPPAKMRMLQQQIEDKTSAAYQRLEWEQLKKRITGKVNKINVENIREVVYELFLDNVVRAKGLLSRSIIQAQAFSPAYTNVYSCLVAVINSKFPQIGELIIRRLVIQFKRAFKRNDKTVATTAAKFIAHLVNQQVLHEILALEILTLLLETPTNDSVEVAIAFLKECGSKLTEVCSFGITSIYERLRHVSNEADLEPRIGYMIDVAFAIRKDKFAAHPALMEDLDLVDEDDQITHTIMLDDPQDPENMLNIFKFDEEYAKNEEMYEEIKKEILGENDDDDEDGDSDEEESGDEAPEKKTTVVDNTETNLLAFRRTVYLVIQSSMGFEECVHKLKRMNIAPSMEAELCSMVLDTCCQQRTYERFYGLLAERLCRIKREFQQNFEAISRDTYDVVHRFDLTKMRIAARFIGHLLHTDAISWNVLSHIRLNKNETTSAGRIYIKILFLELEEFLGLETLYKRISDPTMQSAFDGLFPRDDPESTKFAINFYINIGLGGLTAGLQEHFKHGRKKQTSVFPSVPEAEPSGSEAGETTESSEEDESDEESEDSEEERRRRKKAKKREKKEKKEKKKAKKAKKRDRARS